MAVPYAAGELLARVRERGTVEIEYRERDVRVAGRVAPALAGELRAAAARWAEIAPRGGPRVAGPPLIRLPRPVPIVVRRRQHHRRAGRAAGDA